LMKEVVARVFFPGNPIVDAVPAAISADIFAVLNFVSTEIDVRVVDLPPRVMLAFWVAAIHLQLGWEARVADGVRGRNTIPAGLVRDMTVSAFV
jgi:hypothetical protein